MSAPLRDWKVLPHDSPVAIDDNILTVVGEIRMPVMVLPRRMTVARLHDARLVIFSAIALADKEMAALDLFGRPAFLIVPNGRHRLDARIWKDRYPALQVIAPEGARAKVAEVVPVDTSTPDFDDADVQFITVAGTRSRESALLVRSPTGTTLVLNDIVGNIRDASGFTGWFLGLVGFSGPRPQIPKVVKMALVDDRNALRAQLTQWADIASLTRILVSHGAVIDADPRRILRELADSLA